MSIRPLLMMYSRDTNGSWILRTQKRWELTPQKWQSGVYQRTYIFHYIGVDIVVRHYRRNEVSNIYSNSGGCLTAILSLKISQMEIWPKPIFQIMLCPVIDNTATVETAWAKSGNAPWLTPSRMTWYRDMYFSSSSEATHWDASPCFAPTEILARSPQTFIAVSECDLLAPEALKFGESLKKAGVSTRVKIYKGATHSILVLAG